MSATIIQFIPRPNPNREANLERQAIEIINVALMGDPGMVGIEPNTEHRTSQRDP